MDFTYDWKWGPMRTHSIDQLSNVVIGIDYVCMCSDLNSDQRAKRSGTMPVQQPDPDGFVAVDQITAAMVDGWIAAWGEKSQVEAAAAETLRSMLGSQPTMFPMPSGE